MKKMFLVSLLALFFISCGDRENKDEFNEESVNSVRNTVVSGKNTVISGESKSVKDLFAGVRFVRIPAGKFIIGISAREQDSNEAQVPVEISKPFEIMTTEVTQAQYTAVIGKNPSFHKESKYCSNYDTEKDMCPDHPVEQVSWNDVQIFIKKLNESKGLKGCKGFPIDPSGCYRLPTEAEWEYAVRAGTTSAYFFGNDPSQVGYYVIYNKNSENQTQRVGSKSPNPYELYDVYGNVWEWVQDAYKKSLPRGKDPLVTTGSERVIRGGSYHYRADYLGSFFRFRFFSFYRDKDIGFRLVRTL